MGQAGRYQFRLGPLVKHRRFRISDHALVRYLERVQGFDVDAMRRAIHDELAPALDHPGANALVSGGFKYHFENGVLKTITPASQPGIGQRRKRK